MDTQEAGTKIRLSVKVPVVLDFNANDFNEVLLT